MKTFLRLSLVVLLLTITGFFSANFYISQKIQALLGQEPGISFSTLSVNSFTGNLNLKDFRLEESSKTLIIGKVDLNVAILHYLINKEIRVEFIRAENIDLKANLSPERSGNSRKAINLDIVSIEEVDLKALNIELIEKNNIVFETHHLNIAARDLSWPLDEGYDWLNNENLNIEAEAMSYDLDDLHLLTSERFAYSNQTAEFSKFKIEPKFSRADYIHHIKIEKDLIDFEAETLSISDPKCSKKDGVYRLMAKKIHIDSSISSIYRDKTIADDTSIKPLYSESLRNLDFKIKVDSVVLSNSKLSYLELMKKNQSPGEIEFNFIDGYVANLHNFLEQEHPEIKTEIKAKFTEESDIYFNLSLVPDHENFQLSTTIKKAEDRSVNGFFAPAMRMKLDGRIDNIETSFRGDNSEMNGDFSMAYEKLKLNILRKDGSKNNFASLLSNVFVNNRNVNKKLQLEGIKRDPTKSFWNYVWTFHLNGLKKSLL
jgi:hypothetical protein